MSGARLWRSSRRRKRVCVSLGSRLTPSPSLANSQRDVVQRVARTELLLQQVNAQHRFHRHRRATGPHARAVRFDALHQRSPRHHALLDELALARFLDREDQPPSKLLVVPLAVARSTTQTSSIPARRVCRCSLDSCIRWKELVDQLRECPDLEFAHDVCPMPLDGSNAYPKISRNMLARFSFLEKAQHFSFANRQRG